MDGNILSFGSIEVSGILPKLFIHAYTILIPSLHLFFYFSSILLFTLLLTCICSIFLSSLIAVLCLAFLEYIP